MKRYEVEPGRFVPVDMNSEPSLCQCKPWQECDACGYVEHAGSFCSWCRRKDALRVLVARPFGGLQASKRERSASAATSRRESAA